MGRRDWVCIDENADKPYSGSRRAVLEDSNDRIRPEVCFGGVSVVDRSPGQWVGSSAGSRGAQGRRMLRYSNVETKREGPWRFKVRDHVAVRTDTEGDGTGKVEWLAGSVHAVATREREMLPDRCAAYRIRLESDEGLERRLGPDKQPHTRQEFVNNNNECLWNDAEPVEHMWVRTVWAAKDEHWLIRSLEHQAPRADKPSIKDNRLEFRPISEAGDAASGEFGQGQKKWECFDHVTGEVKPWHGPPPDGASIGTVPR